MKRQKEKIKYLICSISIIIFGILLSIIIGLTTNHAIPLNFDAPKLSGIDVSSHNGEIDWNKIKSSVDFAFIRVGYRGWEQGSLNKDKNAQTNLRQANKNKLPVGVYVYSQATTVGEAIEEANFALDSVKWHDISLPIIIDFEYPTNKDGKNYGRLYDANLTNKQRTDIINAFCQTIKDAGYEYGVYANANTYSYQLNADDFIDGTVVWVAHYSNKLKYTKNVDIWQYSKTGTMDGVASKYVDLNYWFKDSESLDDKNEQ